MKARLNLRLASGLLAGLAAVATSLPAAAVELTPLVGVRFGGNFSNDNCYCYQPSLSLDSSASYGAELDIPFAHGPYALEVYYSHQNTTLNGGEYLVPQVHDMNVNVIQVGVSAAMPTNDKNFSWLITLSGGATVFDAGGYYGNETYPSLGVGVGVRYMANEHIGLRADLRGIFTFADNGNSFIVCNGGCSGYYSGSTIVQGEASVGVVIRF